MGIVYSALLAAAPNNSTIASIVRPINAAVSGFHWCMTPVYKIWFSGPVQGAVADAIMINDLYVKYLFPYVMAGTFLLATLGPDSAPHSQQFSRLQLRYQIDSEIERNPKFEQRYAELQGLA